MDTACDAPVKNTNLVVVSFFDDLALLVVFDETIASSHVLSHDFVQRVFGLPCRLQSFIVRLDGFQRGNLLLHSRHA